MVRVTRWAVIGLLLGGLSEARADIVLFNQPTDLQAGYDSQNDTGSFGFGNFATSYDNFTLSANSTVNAVSWAGSFANPATHGTITAFTLTFYSNAGGIPGAALASIAVPGAAGETSLGNNAAGDPAYSYTADISATPFAATGGTEYWISIVPDLAYPPLWQWETATGGDSGAYQVFFGSGASRSVDLALTLSGVQTNEPPVLPEPGTLTLAGLGAVGLVAGAIRRRRQTAVAV